MNVLNYENLLTGFLCLPALYMWRQLYRTYRTSKNQYEDELLFQKRHNCVIMYTKNYMTGWPPKDVIHIDTSNLNHFLEPFIYFIDTARSSLEIAVMRIAIVPLFDALKRAVLRGVQVRILVNFLTSKSMREEYRVLLKAGAKVCFYVDKTEKLNSVLHYKYMVKDYDGSVGFLCMGSLNFTGITAVLNNYEDVTFTTNIHCVEAFHNNFNESWEQISRDNDNTYNKTVLREYGFL